MGQRLISAAGRHTLVSGPTITKKDGKTESITFLETIGWFKGKITGNFHISWENRAGFLQIFPEVNPLIETSARNLSTKNRFESAKHAVLDLASEDLWWKG